MNKSASEDLILRDTGPKGLGVFAARNFVSGEQVLRFEGTLLSAQSIADFTHAIQVDIDRFLGPSGGLDDYVNHSCEPNCRLVSTPPGLELYALCPIGDGEELSFDYSTCLVFEPSLPLCFCGTALCRGRIDAFWSLSPDVRRRYRAQRAVPGFVLASRPTHRVVRQHAPLLGAPFQRRKAE
jgi:SET domain-containing protein